MAYCTQTDVTNRFSQAKWWSDQAQAGAIDAAIVAANIGFAAGEINRYVGQQYDVPLTLSDAGTASMISDAATLLTGWKLASRVNDRDALAAMDAAYKDLMSWLREIAAGKVKLKGETITSAESPTGGVVVAGDEVVVTRESMSGL